MNVWFNRTEEEPASEPRVETAAVAPVPVETVSVPDPVPASSHESSISTETRNGIQSVAEPVKSNKRKGVHSDEVRVMQKVLVNEVSYELIIAVRLKATSFVS